MQKADMTVDQMMKFVCHVKQQLLRLDTVVLAGGEPFVHPGIQDMINLLFYELLCAGYIKHIRILTNGLIKNGLDHVLRDPNIKRALELNFISLDPIYPIDERPRVFSYVLSAPVDLGLEYNVCEFPNACGICLNAYGYWPGGGCATVAMLFNVPGYAKREFPTDFHSTWPNLRADLCKFCIWGCNELKNKTTGTMSKSYREAIHNWMRGNSADQFERF